MTVKKLVFFGVALVQNVDFSSGVVLNDLDGNSKEEELATEEDSRENWPSMPTMPDVPDLKKHIMGGEEEEEKKLKEKEKKEAKEAKKEAIKEEKKLDPVEVWSCIAHYKIEAGAILKLVGEGAEEGAKKAKISEKMTKEIEHLSGEAVKGAGKLNIDLSACAQEKETLVGGAAKFLALCESMKTIPEITIVGPKVGSCPKFSVPCESPLAKKAIEFGLEKGAGQSKVVVEKALANVTFYRQKIGSTCDFLKGLEEKLEGGAKAAEKEAKGSVMMTASKKPSKSG